jgi:hypothetical protein
MTEKQTSSLCEDCPVYGEYVGCDERNCWMIRLENRNKALEVENQKLKDDLKIQEEMYAIAYRKILDEKCLRADVTEKAEAEVKDYRALYYTGRARNGDLETRLAAAQALLKEADCGMIDERGDQRDPDGCIGCDSYFAAEPDGVCWWASMRKALGGVSPSEGKS